MLAPSGLPTTPLVAMFIQQTGLSTLEKGIKMNLIKLEKLQVGHRP